MDGWKTRLVSFWTSFLAGRELAVSFRECDKEYVAVNLAGGFESSGLGNSPEKMVVFLVIFNELGCFGGSIGTGFK